MSEIELEVASLLSPRLLENLGVTVEAKASGKDEFRSRGTGFAVETFTQPFLTLLRPGKSWLKKNFCHW